MKARGFTLIEVLIAIGVIGVLSAIAVPIYRGYVAKAEAASETVAGLGSNLQNQLDAAEAPGNATGPSGTTTPSTSTAGNNTAPANGTSTANPTNTDPTPVAQPGNTTGGTTQENPAASNTAGSSTPATSGATASTGSNSGASASTNTASGGTGGGSGGGATPPKSAIVPPEDFANCISSKCKVAAGGSYEMAFNVKAVEKVKKENINVVATADAKAEDVSFNAQTGIVSLELQAPKKAKDFTLTLNAGKEKIVLNFTAKES